MIKRVLLFLGWAVVGCVLVYAGFYAFTPYGISLIALALAAGALLPQVDGRRLPEAFGAACGPGVFFLAIASETGQPMLALSGGLLMISLVVAAYAWAVLSIRQH